MPDKIAPTEVVVNKDKKPASPQFSWVKLAFYLFALLFLIVLAGGGYTYWRLLRTNMILSQSVTKLRTQVFQQANTLTTLQQETTASQTSLKEVQETVTQQAQQIQEWRTIEQKDNWRLAEARYLVNLANDQVELTHNIPLAINLLKAANKIVQQSNDASLLEIRKAIDADLAALEATSLADTTDLYLRLSRINNEVDNLSLSLPVAEQTKTPALATPTQSTVWWKKGLNQTWYSLRQLVTVRYMPPNSLPFIMPEQKRYLYANLHSEIENAMWAVLHTNDVVYQASIDQASAWIQQYFLTEAPATQKVIADLAALKEIHLQPTAPSLSATLKAFQDYFAQRNNVAGNSPA